MVSEGYVSMPGRSKGLRTSCGSDRVMVSMKFLSQLGRLPWDRSGEVAVAEGEGSEAETPHTGQSRATKGDNDKAEGNLTRYSHEMSAGGDSDGRQGFYTVNLGTAVWTTEAGTAVALPLRRRPGIGSLWPALVLLLVFCGIGTFRCLHSFAASLSDVP